MAGPARAADKTGPGGSTIDITLKIDLIGDDAMKAKIERALHNGDPFRFCGKKVEFKADVKIIPPGGRRRPDAHLVNQHTIPSGTYAVSNVQTSEEIAGYDPTNQNATGYWSSNAPDEVVAHELGHLLGLPDEYQYVDRNNNSRRDADEPSTPKPEYNDDGSLMAESGGHALQRQIDEIMEKHNVPDKLYPCKWEGTFDYTIDQNVPTGNQHSEAHLVIRLDEDKGGLHGTVTGDLTQVLSLSACPSTTETPAHATVEVGGEARRPTQDHLVPSIQLKVLSESYTPLVVSPCPGAGRPGLMNGGRVYMLKEALAKLERHFDDSYQYESRQTFTQSQYPFTVTWKVEVHPVR